MVDIPALTPNTEPPETEATPDALEVQAPPAVASVNETEVPTQMDAEDGEIAAGPA